MQWYNHYANYLRGMTLKNLNLIAGPLRYCYYSHVFMSLCMKDDFCLTIVLHDV